MSEAAGVRRYFAYGSNMHSQRLGRRLGRIGRLGVYALAEHLLRFHKVGKDGSGKCDAFHTGKAADAVWGVLYEIDMGDEATLDRIEGLGVGYHKAQVRLADAAGASAAAFTYRAIRINATLRPFAWYKRHVLEGAREAGLPADYIAAIAGQAAIEDPCAARANAELAIHRCPA